MRKQLSVPVAALVAPLLTAAVTAGLIAALTAGAGFNRAAVAHGGAKGAVKDRMEAMEDIEEMMERLYAMYRGDLPYSAKAVKKAAGEIRKRAGASLTGLFPKGSDGKPSEARPEIWTRFAEFERLAGRLELIAAALEKRDDPRPSKSSVLPEKWEKAVPGNMMGGGMMGGSGGMMGGSGGSGQGNRMPGGGSGGMMGGSGGSGQGNRMPGSGSGGMMGGAQGGGPSPEMLAGMPADMLVLHMSHLCNVCHTNFRKEE